MSILFYVTHVAGNFLGINDAGDGLEINDAGDLLLYAPE